MLICITARVHFIKTVIVKDFVLGAIDININNIHMEMALLRQNIIILLQVAIIRSEIWDVDIIISIV